jgi:hypothetical protein
MNLLSPAMHLPGVPPSGERKEEGMGSREHWRLNLPCLALRVSPSSCASSPGRKREAGACAAGEEEGLCGSGREDERADHERRRGGELYPRAGAGRCGRITLLHRAGGRSPRPTCAQAASKGGRRSVRRGRSGGGAPHSLHVLAPSLSSSGRALRLPAPVLLPGWRRPDSLAAALCSSSPAPPWQEGGGEFGRSGG